MLLSTFLGICIEAMVQGNREVKIPGQDDYYGCVVGKLLTRLRWIGMRQVTKSPVPRREIGVGKF